jgi:glycosyltransferase involved in cell wall biosynthesis
VADALAPLVTTPIMRVAHVITGLEMGGAEHMLAKVAVGLADRVAQQVISLRDDGVFSEQLRAAGIPVHALGMRGVRDLRRGVRETAAHLSAFRPSVVQSWMYHAQLVGGAAASRARVPGTIWNIRANRITPDVERWRTVALARGGGLLARRWARAIVCNSDAAVRAHAAWGYPVERMRRIDNGFDTHSLAPNPGHRAALRAQLNVPAAARLVGMLGRRSAIKGQAYFLRAAVALAAAHPDVHFLLAGPGVDQPDPELDPLAADASLHGRVHRLGAITPPDRVLAGLDIAVIPSVDEAFPNVLGEAMACGLPCVATDVGDCRRVLDGHGRIVPARDPGAIARAVQELLALPTDQRVRIGIAARQRVVAAFSMPVVLEAYHQLYLDVAT